MRNARVMSPGFGLFLCLLAVTVLQVDRASAGEPATGVPVLIYHEIVTNRKEPGETVITLDRFAEQMRYLSEHQFHTISVRELVDYMKGGTAPEHAVVLSFDDGYKSALNAVPILKQYGFKASFWIISGKGIGGFHMGWPDIDSLARNPNFEIGSHSVTHPWDTANSIVTWVNGRTPGKGVADAVYELTESKRTIEKRLGKEIRYFAWPCGWYTDSLVTLAKRAGYEALLTTQSGVNLPGGDVFRIKRTFIDGACNMADFIETLRTGRYASCQRRGRGTLGHLPSGTK